MRMRRSSDASFPGNVWTFRATDTCRTNRLAILRPTLAIPRTDGEEWTPSGSRTGLHRGGILPKVGGVDECLFKNEFQDSLRENRLYNAGEYMLYGLARNDALGRSGSHRARLESDVTDNGCFDKRDSTRVVTPSERPPPRTSPTSTTLVHSGTIRRDPIRCRSRKNGQSIFSTHLRLYCEVG